MITHARMKKFTVDNKVDKDGCPDPIIQLQVEMSFQESVARDLASMTNGQMLVLALDPLQETLAFGDAKAKPQLSVHSQYGNYDTQDLVDRNEEISEAIGQYDAEDPIYQAFDREQEDIIRELNSRSLYYHEGEWIERGAAADQS